MPTKNEPLNTVPLQQFIQQVKSADAGNQREIRLDLQNAKRLAFTLGEVMARLNGDLEDIIIKNASGENEVIQVQVNSNSNW